LGSLARTKRDESAIMFRFGAMYVMFQFGILGVSGPVALRGSGTQSARLRRASESHGFARRRRGGKKP